MGPVVEGIGNIRQGNAARRMSKFNAAVALNNKKIHENNAIAAQQDAYKSKLLRLKVGQRIAGAQKARAIKSGTTTGGSVADLMNDSALQVEQDALQEVIRGKERATSFRNQAADSSAKATLTTMQGRATRNAYYFKAAANFMDAAASGIGAAGMK